MKFNVFFMSIINKRFCYCLLKIVSSLHLQIIDDTRFSGDPSEIAYLRIQYKKYYHIHRLIVENFNNANYEKNSSTF